MKEPKNMFAAPFSFEGRIRRMEYGLSYILYLVVYFCAKTMMEFESTISILGFVLLIPAFWFLLAQSAKRCHDLGNSGWYQLIPFYFFWLICEDGEPCENAYGDDPKGREMSDE